MDPTEHTVSLALGVIRDPPVFAGRRMHLREWIWKLHFKNVHVNFNLKIFRALSIVIWLMANVIDCCVYSQVAQQTFFLRFLCLATFPLYEISTCIYAAGAIVFGVSLEIYLHAIFPIVNLVLVIKQCGDSHQRTVAIIWLVKTTFLLLATELVYRNFRQLPGYLRNFNRAALCMLHQSLFFAVTIILLSTSGLRAVYNSANFICLYNTTGCHIVDIYTPTFSHRDPCENEFIDYVAGREQLRIIRNLFMINIAVYAIFNKALLDIGKQGRFYMIRLILLLLFLALASSLIVASIEPFQFPSRKLYFDIIECLLFVFIISLLTINIIMPKRLNEETTVIANNPSILPMLA